jgi:hypothetical protein
MFYSFLLPLFGWARFGVSEGLSPVKTARRIHRRWLRSGRESAEGHSETSHPLKLRWPERQSFFDPVVQEVLQERHPSDGSFGRKGFKGYAIDAWKVAEQFGRTAGSCERSLAEFGVFMRLDPVWISSLLSAVTKSQEEQRHTRGPAPSAVNSENRRRARIMHEWAECWIAHYRLHSDSAKDQDTATKPCP